MKKELRSHKLFIYDYNINIQKKYTDNNKTFYDCFCIINFMHTRIFFSIKGKISIDSIYNIHKKLMQIYCVMNGKEIYKKNNTIEKPFKTYIIFFEGYNNDDNYNN